MLDITSDIQHPPWLFLQPLSPYGNVQELIFMRWEIWDLKSNIYTYIINLFLEWETVEQELFPVWWCCVTFKEGKKVIYVSFGDKTPDLDWYEGLLMCFDISIGLPSCEIHVKENYSCVSSPTTFPPTAGTGLLILLLGRMNLLHPPSLILSSISPSFPLFSFVFFLQAIVSITWVISVKTCLHVLSRWGLHSHNLCSFE